MDLGGRWLAAEADEELLRRLPDDDLDDGAWEAVEVPGQWRQSPAFAASNGPVLYRRRFAAAAPEIGRRAWLTFDGLFYQADVWLDGSYLGDTEGYFAPRAFEVTEQLAAATEHLLAVEVACPPQTDRRRKHSLTGVFQHWDCLDPEWNPGGIWAPVGVVETGSVRLAALRMVCREATPERATLDFEAQLDADGSSPVTIRTTVARTDPAAGGPGPAVDEHKLAAGANRVRWRVVVERPDLWWPHALGDQPLYDIDVEVGVEGRRSDARRLVTGLRQIRMRRFVTAVNGERIFLKGANLGPTRRSLADVTADDVERDLDLARAAGLDLLRVHGHIGHPLLYDHADRTGMLIWQDLPLQWGYGQVRRQAVRQARDAVDLLGHHPSIAMWCGHNEPLAVDPALDGHTGRKEIARFVAGQVLPTWNKSGLDQSIRRALERADPSRPVISHSGVLPHPAWGTDTHAYFGWYHGEERDLPGALARWPVLARFVSEFGAQAVPASDDFLEPGRWPNLDWEHLTEAHALQKHIFDRRVPPAAFDTFAEWRDATQRYQADVLRYHVETLRRLKYRPTGGFCMFLLADAQPAVSWSVLDDHRVPKLGYHALQAACAPVIIVADRLAAVYSPGERLDVAVHAVSDRRRDLDPVEATARLTWPGGQRIWRFEGAIPADGCVRIGRLDTVVPGDARPGPLTLDLELRFATASEVGPDRAAAEDPRMTSVRSSYPSRVSSGAVPTTGRTVPGRGA
jgi:beta-mannosidase